MRLVRQVVRIASGVNRADKQTCSQTCRTRLYRQRKERAVVLHAQGKTARAIGRELDAKVDAVTKWITTGGTRSRAEDDSRSETNKVQQP
jgi:hypothetical protein